jgi:23S rRNA (guanosine2251-2'-O)-methyltransferase
MSYEEYTLIGRNAVLEAFRAGKTIDKLFILDGCQDGPIKSILRESKKTKHPGTICIQGKAGLPL